MKQDLEPRASTYVFTVREMSTKEWEKANRARWKLVKEELCYEAHKQAELGLFFGGKDTGKDVTSGDVAKKVDQRVEEIMMEELAKEGPAELDFDPYMVDSDEELSVHEC